MLTAIIVAAGSSRRMGSDKLFEIIAGKPVIAHAIDAFELADCVGEIIVVTRGDRSTEIRRLTRNQSFKKVRAIITGGERRQDSVRAGLGNLSPDARYVAVHDAARPLVTPEQIRRVFERCEIHQIYAMQTPQIFERAWIEEAYREVYAKKVSVTDEVSAVERLGRKVFLLPNDDFNFKITYPRDLPLAEFVLKQRTRLW